MKLAVELPTLLALAAGLVILLIAWLPLVLRRAPLSLPIVAIALGYAMFSWRGLAPVVEPHQRGSMALRERALIAEHELLVVRERIQFFILCRFRLFRTAGCHHNGAQQQRGSQPLRLLFVL